MVIPVLLFLLGLLLLIKGGDWFVDGATGIAHRFHVPELLIGATVVSIGTTLPEVMVSATSALGGHGEIAYGNAIGSIICNTALIAALTIAIRPGTIQRKSLVTPVSFFFLAAAIYAFTAYFSGQFSRSTGCLLLAIFVIYMILTVVQMKKTPQEKTSDEPEEEIPLGKNILLLIIGAVLIAVGANLLVDNGTLIAEALGVPESVIALTFVALGTSLPELVTAITSLAKGHGSLSLGNVIGANLFNIVLVSGTSIVLAPFDIPQSATIAGKNASLVVDIPVMLTVMVILTVPALIRKKLSRTQGILLLLIYVTYCIFEFTL
ncbi:MAG: calcium/sodium antiporter [Candidatus Choladocola sp.]|nr:calcium/sodium antiporter [Candidatus Choladocola sp.]